MTRYFRFAYEQDLPGYDGIDTDTEPFALSKTKAPVVQNFLTDRVGQLTMRGPLTTAHNIPGPVSGPLSSGLVPAFSMAASAVNYTFCGYRACASGGLGIREPWVAPYRGAAAANLLAAGLGQVVLPNNDSGTSETISAAKVPRRGTSLNGNGYYLAYGAASSQAQNGSYFNLCQIYGVSNALVNTQLTNAPDGAQDIRAHLQRLFVLGGRNVAGGAPGAINMNTLYWTDPLATDYTLAASWKDSVTGLVNQIVADVDDPTDFGVALAKCNDNLVIFKRRSIHVLKGYSSTTFSLKPFTHEQGCIDPRSVVEHDAGCFFISAQGFMFFNGSKLTNYTPNLRSTFLAAVLARVGDNGVDGGFAKATLLPNGYIMVTVGAQSMVDGTATVDFCGLFCIARGTWSTFSTSLFTTSGAVELINTPGFLRIVDQPSTIGGVQHFACANAGFVPSPEAAAPTLRGIDTSYVTSGSLVSSSIPALYKSRLSPLGSPIHTSQVHRCTIDYAFRKQGVNDAGAGNGWTVQILSSTGAVICPSQSVAAMGDPSIGTNYPYRREFNYDSFVEALDAQLIVSWPDQGGSPPAVMQADLHQTSFEFVPSAGARSN